MATTGKRFEFAFHLIAAEDVTLTDVDPALALQGSMGWEIRGVTALRDGSIYVALQRPLADDEPAPDVPSLGAALAPPLAGVERLREELDFPPPHFEQP